MVARPASGLPGIITSPADKIKASWPLSYEAQMPD